MSDVRPRLKRFSGYGKMIDPSGRLLHHERPFIREGNYLVYVVIITPSLSYLDKRSTSSYRDFSSYKQNEKWEYLHCDTLKET